MNSSKIMKKSSLSTFLFVVPVGIILAIYSITIFIPLIWGFITSLKSDFDFSVAGNILGLPDAQFSKGAIRFLNYADVINGFKFKQSTIFLSGNRIIQHRSNNNIWLIIMNTFLYAGVGCIIQTFVPCVVGYLSARYGGVMAKILDSVVLIVITMPIVGSYVSSITLLRKFALFDTFVGNWIQKFNFANMYYFVFQAFFKSLSNSYAEAAEIDGASQFRIMVTIMMPLATKIITTVMLILFVGYWNDYGTPLLYLPTKATLAYAVYVITYESNSNIPSIPTKIAGCMILAVPILILYLIFQNKLMGNLSLGGVKE